MTEVLVALGGVALLHVFYRAVAAQWPESYYGLSDFTSYQISLHLARYLTFRFVPVGIVALSVSAIATGLGTNGISAAIVAAAMHAVLTAGRAAFTVFRQVGEFSRRLLLAAHVGVFILLLVAGALGGWLGEHSELRAFIPNIDALTSDLWTAVLAGVFGAYIARVTIKGEIWTSDLVRRSLQHLDPELLTYASTLAARHRTDPNLVQAILIVESLQRPSWVRGLERLLGRVFRIGTYGVMQVESDSPISDWESVELAISSRLAGRMVPMSNGWPDYEVLRMHIRSYNANERFVKLVEEVYHELRWKQRDR